MEIVSRTEGTKVTMEISGWLDTQTAPELEKVLSGLDASVTSLVFDFAKLEYISSAGLRVILSAQKVMNRQGSMLIRKVNENVMDVFEVTGFIDILTIE